jgi:hypothetical protein
MELKKSIKKKLIETKRSKHNLLIEEKIITSRLKMVVGKYENLENFDKLTEEEKGKISIQFIMELAALQEEGLLTEDFNLVDTIKKIFGAGIWAVPEAFAESAINSILNAIGIPDSNVRKFLVSFFATNPSQLLKAFTDCKTLVTHIARAIGETMIMNLQQTKGMGGIGWDMVRNALQNQLQGPAFVQEMEKGLATKVCELLGKFTSNAQGVVDKLKPALSSALKPAS